MSKRKFTSACFAHPGWFLYNYPHGTNKFFCISKMPSGNYTVLYGRIFTTNNFLEPFNLLYKICKRLGLLGKWKLSKRYPSQSEVFDTMPNIFWETTYSWDVYDKTNSLSYDNVIQDKINELEN
jgi:hypothetical protein